MTDFSEYRYMIYIAQASRSRVLYAADVYVECGDDIERKVSPDSIRWQQQVNSSFEALIKRLYTDADTEAPRVDGGESPASVVQSSRPSILDIDWHVTAPAGDRTPSSTRSQRHLECRSDSRDSGLGNDVDRRFDRPVSPAPPPPPPPPVTPYSPSAILMSLSPVHGLSDCGAPNPVKSTDPETNDGDNERLYDSLFKKKFHARQLIRKNEEKNFSDNSGSLLRAEKTSMHSQSFAAPCNVVIGCRADSDAAEIKPFVAADRTQQSPVMTGASRGGRQMALAQVETKLFRDESSGQSVVPQNRLWCPSTSSKLGSSSWEAAAAAAAAAMSRRSYGGECRIDGVPVDELSQLNVNYVALLNGYTRRTSMNGLDFCIPSTHVTGKRTS
jgi:hypothetical protein